jgi:hypothetical protein
MWALIQESISGKGIPVFIPPAFDTAREIFGWIGDTLSSPLDAQLTTL